jgi:CelD/BcsL family acetyltransferase involved in cellulose biosynthesis
VSAHPDWLGACVQAFHHERDELRHVACVADGRVRASLPLVRERRNGVPWLALCGARALCEPGEIVHDSTDALGAVLREAIAMGDPIELARVSVDPALRAGLRRSARGRGLVVRIDAPGTVHVDLRTSGRSMETLMPSAQRRRNIDRCRRRLREYGDVAFRCLRPSAGEVDAMLARALAIEDSGWKGRAGSSMAKRSDLRAFVLGIAHAFAAREALVVTFLMLDGEPVAVQVMLEHGNAWHEVKIGYDERWKPVAPGMQLAVATLLHAAEAGIGRYEFMGNVESRHAAFAHATRDYDTLVYVPFSLRGAQALARIAAQRASHRLAALASRRRS